ncbi:tRNA-specific adenosine deaminase TAD3 isoform X2 [Neltuma alba]|uniref:tRNA-specific adenosine deaminase TAD3 isoform X2 n=1 Tax=Neltuma alba TaxID=207710 RepID=UPI0010A56480|nr:tRNA-specific adenosine deaminase TAD3 isoform X2 [Prosopis alba]
MADSNMAMYQIVHIPDEEQYPLHQQPTEKVIASVIDPKHANHIVRILNRIEPLENLRHVKRVQKKILEAGQIQLSVILCLASDGDNQLDSVPPHLQGLISSYQLSPFIAKVCKYAATSKEEWQEQCKFWPTSYHPRTYNIDGITGFNEEDSQLIFKFMQSAVELTTSEAGLVVNAAVIVDPSTKQNSLVAIPLANKVGANDSLPSNKPSNQLRQPHADVACLYPWRWAEQKSHTQNYKWHPLRHAAMVAIESSAARDRCCFPSVSDIDEKCLELDHEKTSWMASPPKRQRTIPEHVEDDGKLNAVSQSSDQVSARPYLCTGYDIFLVWEPCTMCAMALVHQRIRRIFYAFPNPHAGALGSVHRLQGEKSLNHRYAVFRVLLPEEVLHKRHAEAAETVAASTA